MSDDKDYAHMRDPEAQRTRAELWIIVIIVVVVVAGGLIWRVVEHKPASHQKGYGANSAGLTLNTVEVPAAAGVHTSPQAPHPATP